MAIGWGLDTIIFITFLIINLSVGIFYSRNVHNIREYAIGNRNFATSTLAATIVATWIGGGVLSQTIAETYKQGLYFIIPAIGDSLVLAVIGYFLAPRMAEFLGTLSIAESIGNLYGKKVRLITGVIGIISCVGAVAVQFKVSATVLQLFFNVSSFYAVLASAAIVVLYSSFGGIRAVTFTDVIQFFTFATVIPIISLIIWGTISDPHKIYSTISQHPSFDYKQIFDFYNPKLLHSFLLFLFFIIPTLEPAIFQRITMAKNTAQITNSFIIAAFVCLIMSLLISWIGILLLADNPNLDPNNLLTYIIGTYSYPGLKGLIAIGIIAIIMSTADSYINSAAVIFTNDFCKPLNIQLNDNKALILTRSSAACIGFLAFFLAFNTQSLLKLTLLIWGLYMPIITVPLLLGIFGFRSSSKSILSGMSAGAITIVIFHVFSIKMEPVIPAMLANFTFLLGSHYILKQPGGWVGIKDPTPLIALRLERKRKFKQLVQSIREFNLLRFCISNLPKNEITFSFFGFFVIASTYSSLYTISESTRSQYHDIYNFIYHSVLIISTGFLTYPIWPAAFKNQSFIAVVWNFGIFYLLICIGSQLVIISKFNQLQLMIFMINLLITATLLKWQTTLFITIIGTFASVQFFKWYMGTEYIAGNLGDMQFQIIYLMLLFSSALLAFLKPKQQNEEISEVIRTYLDNDNKQKQFEMIKLSQHRKEFVARLDEQCINVFKSVYNQINSLEINKLDYELDNNVDNLKDKQKEKGNELIKIIDKLKAGAEYLDKVIFEVKDQIKIHPIHKDLLQFVYDLIEEYKKISIFQRLEIFVDIKTNINEIEIDTNLIKKAIFICFNHGLQSSNSARIFLVVKSTKIEYDLIPDDPLIIRREGVEFSIIIDNSTLNPQHIDQLLHPTLDTIESLEFIELYKIIEAHYGKVTIVLNELGQVIYTITIPARLKEIRPKKMNLPDGQLEQLREVNAVITATNKEVLHNVVRELIKIGMDSATIAKITKLSLEEIESFSS